MNFTRERLVDVAIALCCIIACCLLASCGKRLTPDSNVIARVGARVITGEDFERELRRREGIRPGMHTNQVLVRELLDEMIQFAVLRENARIKGFDTNADVLRSLDQIIVAKFSESEHKEGRLSAGSISEDSIHEFYAAHQDDFKEREEVNASIIFLGIGKKAETSKRAQLQARAEELRGQAIQTNKSGFASLAKRYSEDQATRYQGGELGWLPARGTDVALPEEVKKALAELRKENEISPLIAVNEGFYLLRINGFRGGGVKPLAEVKELIAYKIRQRENQSKKEIWLNGLKSNVTIEIKEDLVSNIASRAKLPGIEAPASMSGR